MFRRCFNYIILIRFWIELCSSTIELNCRATDRGVTRRRGVEMCPILSVTNDPVAVIGKSQNLTNRARLLIWPLVRAVVVPNTISSNLNRKISLSTFHWEFVNYTFKYPLLILSGINSAFWWMSSKGERAMQWIGSSSSPFVQSGTPSHRDVNSIHSPKRAHMRPRSNFQYKCHLTP